MSCASTLAQHISSKESASLISSHCSTTLLFGFAAGFDRSIQVFLESFVEVSECDELNHISFTKYFSPTLVALLRQILDAVRSDW